MTYTADRVIHDADSHVQEVPGTFERYLSSKYLAQWQNETVYRSFETDTYEEPVRLQADPEFRAGAADNLMTRKRFEALGAYDRADRMAAMDLLGFKSQLMFTTTSLANFGLEHTPNRDLAIECGRAHTRMMADFCADDPRLLATGYVPLVDIELAPKLAEEAVELGCKALLLPSRCPATHSHSHSGLDPLWAFIQETGLPVIFHLGGEEKMADAYSVNGGPRAKDAFGGDENFTAHTMMAVPLSAWQTLATMIFDGVWDRFPDLKFAAVELGGSWVPSWLKWMDNAYTSFYKPDIRMQKLSARPSEIARRQFKCTFFFTEDARWAIEQAGEEIFMFSSDYPHIEGGRDPLRVYTAALRHAGNSVNQRFFKDNFIELMGSGLDPALHD
jgi:predicted TIM-barrel fold metal-dependent hydrolase